MGFVIWTREHRGAKKWHLYLDDIGTNALCGHHWIPGSPFVSYSIPDDACDECLLEVWKLVDRDKVDWLREGF